MNMTRAAETRSHAVSPLLMLAMSMGPDYETRVPTQVMVRVMPSTA